MIRHGKGTGEDEVTEALGVVVLCLGMPKSSTNPPPPARVCYSAKLNVLLQLPAVMGTWHVKRQPPAADEAAKLQKQPLNLKSVAIFFHASDSGEGEMERGDVDLLLIRRIRRWLRWGGKMWDW
ncbi:hypothetical protein RHMOL_Rhmol05G0067400 [Rhododendron molle]|uniref:Uncharacterized protein n=1 Tax=Rhododendron molle TaxID=49168 RepID=A0ACC0NLB9_RHOML|nr:hypothetical protein RHMOL_Rhmol05G0067400 [Rhododendron molle]